MKALSKYSNCRNVEATSSLGALFQNFIYGLLGKSGQLSMCKLQEGTLHIAITLYFLCYCSWGNPFSAFFRGFRAIQNARSPKLSRTPELSFNNQTPNEAPKGKTDGGGPRPKKNQKYGFLDLGSPRDLCAHEKLKLMHYWGCALREGVCAK